MSHPKGVPNPDPTLCWDCANATKPHVCPWVGKQEPVPGWKAKPHLVGRFRWNPFESYHVMACPLFEEDAYCGGTLEDEEAHHSFPHIDDDDVRNLAEAIIERWIDDWELLERGKLRTVKMDSQYVHRDRVISFFYSCWFAELLASFSQHTPKWVRDNIGMTEEWVQIIMRDRP